jgi:hypothetical protein
VCATGTSEVIATSETDWGMNFQVTGTYVDDSDESLNFYVRRLGRGEMTGGERQGTVWNCVRYYSDGSTVLTSSKATAGGAENTFVAGTGRFEGVSGNSIGLSVVAIGKPPKGAFASCRKLRGTLVLN